MAWSRVIPIQQIRRKRYGRIRRVEVKGRRRREPPSTNRTVLSREPDALCCHGLHVHENGPISLATVSRFTYLCLYERVLCLELDRVKVNRVGEFGKIVRE